MKPTKFTNEAELKALFDHAVRAIGFYEARRREALMALESLRRALNNRQPKPPTLRVSTPPRFTRRGGGVWETDSPQTRHKPARPNSENGGFLRVTEDRYFVAKPLIFAVLRKLLSNSLLI